MNIETSSINRTNDTQSTKTSSTTKSNSSVKFSDELNELKETKEKDTATSKKASDSKEVNQSEDNSTSNVKNPSKDADNNKKGETLINKDLNIIENKDLMPQMNPNMNFGGNGQPFSSFMNNQDNSDITEKLTASAKELAEEAAILSTMAENIAMANRNNALQNKCGINKTNNKTTLSDEISAKYDSIIMNKADVEFFNNLVNKTEININGLTSESIQKSAQISKTLADMLAKSMENNQPIRINFDNDISIIIRISRDGKLSAEFLPSSQIAEAYLKENLPILKQKFEENNLEYENLSQRERRQQDKENHRKKGQENE